MPDTKEPVPDDAPTTGEPDAVGKGKSIKGSRSADGSLEDGSELYRQWHDERLGFTRIILKPATPNQ